MDAIGMLYIRVSSEHCPCCKTSSGGLAWHGNADAESDQCCKECIHHEGAHAKAPN